MPVPVVESTVQQWESGQRLRGPSRDQLEALDRRVEAGGCLVDIYQAVDSPLGLNPDLDWYKNFQGNSGPCWAWLRTADSGPVPALLDAGPFRLTVSVPPGDGVFVQAFGFASNPAVRVRLGQAGWVDFGIGIVPPALGVEVVTAHEFAIMGPSADRDPAMSLVPWMARERFGRSSTWFEAVKAQFGQRAEVAQRLLTGPLKSSLGAPADLSDASVPDEESAQQLTGEQLRRVREARGLSLDDAALQASRTDSGLSPISRDQVQRLELGRSPRVGQLLARLDTAYRLDGRSGLTPVDVVPQQLPAGAPMNRYQVRFPRYWVGPVWVLFTADAPALAGVAQLVWSPWRKRIRLDHTVAVTCRRSSESSAPLVVKVSAGWSVRAGTGRHPSAVDVNEGWGFVDLEGARRTLKRYYDVMVQATQSGVGQRP